MVDNFRWEEWAPKNLLHYNPVLVTPHVFNVGLSSRSTLCNVLQICRYGCGFLLASPPAELRSFNPVGFYLKSISAKATSELYPFYFSAISGPEKTRLRAIDKL